MGHPQIVGVQGRAPDPARYGIYPVPAVPQGYPQAYQPVPFPPPPPVVAYPACGQVPYAAPSYPYVYPSPYVPVVYQNAVPPGYYPYAHPVPTYMPPPQQRQAIIQLKSQANTMVPVCVAAIAVSFKLAAGAMEEVTGDSQIGVCCAVAITRES
ncbi:hypothetical protein FOC1_g10014642 [Fusarium oxysporum f. sp. cubense race 1]|uniref:Uncharacterized protein n=1 Tax=Fusarium oxysporum f. sp. cubense (strain race 1) TaxID=1229664 RepID=N4UFM6_FUSC1|nr:hypothetical protein FOC1_g10014642 [Fusarium oxysporum f. sp. cubense race 1]